MRLAYADPPYPGCAHLYPEKTEVDHVALVAKLCEYDGWALSTNENALQYVLGLCPPRVRILAWCKPNAPPFDVHPFHSWEPVICVPARPEPPTIRVASHIVAAKHSGFVAATPFPGVKPPQFCEWVIRCLGAEPTDAFDDLYPGTGAMGQAWEKFVRQLPIWQGESKQLTRGQRSRIRNAPELGAPSA